MIIVLIFSCKKSVEKIIVVPPTIMIGQINNITFSSVKVGAQITSSGNGSITERGFIYDSSPQVTFNNNKVLASEGSREFSVDILGLKPNTRYFIRAFATNSAGTSFSDEISFTTSINLPTISTNQISNVTFSSATSGGNITDDGGSRILIRGVCWATKQNPTVSDSKTQDGIGLGSFNSTLSGLSNNTTYYLRAYATNDAGTSYGSQVEFKTLSEPVLNTALSYGILNDIDGNSYPTIQIGTQIWMAQDLKTSRYANGDPISNVSDGATWVSLKTGAFSFYNNDSTLSAITNSGKSYYGKWYNWYSVVDNRKLCPTGWHVPSSADWMILINFLGGEAVSGGKIRSVNTMWKAPNNGANNQSGFSSLPSGYRFFDGRFLAMGEQVAYWSSTESSLSNAVSVFTSYAIPSLVFPNNPSTALGYPKIQGQPVRCVKD